MLVVTTNEIVREAKHIGLSDTTEKECERVASSPIEFSYTDRMISKSGSYGTKTLFDEISFLFEPRTFQILRSKQCFFHFFLPTNSPY